MSDASQLTLGELWRRGTRLHGLFDRLRTAHHPAMNDSHPMFRGPESPYKDRRNERKLRLLMCACSRRIWDALTLHSRAAVEAIEGLVEENIPDAKRELVESAAYASVPQSIWSIEYHPDQVGRWVAAAYLQDVLSYTPRCIRARFGTGREKDAEERAQCKLLRDIFGNPFRPVTFAPEWRTDTAVALARTMYAAREFSAMPILADALQDAGCDSADILNHCRDPKQVHVRGCWVVDLVLGKA